MDSGWNPPKPEDQWLADLRWCAVFLEEISAISSSKMREMCGFDVVQQREYRKQWIKSNSDIMQLARVINKEFSALEMEIHNQVDTRVRAIFLHCKAPISEAVNNAVDEAIKEHIRKSRL